MSATLSAEPDREPGNDTAFAAVHAAPPARVLVVGEGAGAVGLADRLAGAGLAPTVVGPDRVPGRLSRLAAWDALVLVDTPAQALGLDQLAAIEAFVADLGRGVVLTGGRQSFAAGGWHGTVLAEMAPVSLDPPPREEREPVALVLMIDQSASMGSIEGRGDLTKLDLAREAAALAAEVLHPGDTLGVVAYDDGARWLVPPARVEAGLALAEVERRLAGLTTGGGTRIRAALELGLPALARLEDVPTRHAVLLSDGRDFDPEADHAREVLAAQAAGVTLSAIAIGSDVDRALLGRLAQLGRGRFHVAAEPADLPRLAVEESAIVRARSEQTGAFRAAAAAGAPHPALAGVDVAALPELTGYLALRARPGGGLALEAPNRDPLLAAWQYGRGRVAAWTSDVGEAWAGAWAGDAAAAAFWARLAYYVARVPDAGPPGVAVAWDGPRARVDVDAVDGDGRAVDLARVSLTITGTDAARTVDLHQTAPGRYAADIALDRPGAYPATVSLARPTDAARSGRDGAPAFPPAAVPVALAWSYPAELRVGADGDRTLASIARAGGGQVRSALDPVPPAGAGGRIELWPWLLGAAAGLWVFDVARQMGMMDGLSRRPSRAR